LEDEEEEEKYHTLNEVVNTEKKNIYDEIQRINLKFSYENQLDRQWDKKGALKCSVVKMVATFRHEKEERSSRKNPSLQNQIDFKQDQED
jgi:hypothetical protein